MARELLGFRHSAGLLAEARSGLATENCENRRVDPDRGHGRIELPAWITIPAPSSRSELFCFGVQVAARAAAVLSAGCAVASAAARTANARRAALAFQFIAFLLPTLLLAALESLERCARSAAARRQRAAGRHRIGGTALDAKLAPYYAAAVVPALERLAPRIASARHQLEALDEFPGDVSHAEFKALTALRIRLTWAAQRSSPRPSVRARVTSRGAAREQPLPNAAGRRHASRRACTARSLLPSSARCRPPLPRPQSRGRLRRSRP